MWLRDFLSEDFPQCRTMIYGYNSNLKDQTIHEIPDYTDSFLETIKNARESEEVGSSSQDKIVKNGLTTIGSEEANSVYRAQFWGNHHISCTL